MLLKRLVTYDCRSSNEIFSKISFKLEKSKLKSLISFNPKISFAEKVVHACEPLPAYARVDVMWDNEDQLAVSEVELVEPELWFRECPEAADVLAGEVDKLIRNK